MRYAIKSIKTAPTILLLLSSFSSSLLDLLVHGLQYSVFFL